MTENCPVVFLRKGERVFRFSGRFALALAPASSLSLTLSFSVLQDSDTPHCRLATLTLHHVRPADEGEYLLLVRSAGGASEGSVVLNVTVAEGYSAAPRPRQGLGLLCAAVLVAFLAVGSC